MFFVLWVKRLSLTRASAAVNCQLTVCGRVLRAHSQADTSRRKVSISAIRRLTALPGQNRQFTFRNIEPTAVFRRKMPLETRFQAMRFFRGETLVQKMRLVRTQIVTHQHDFLRIQVHHVRQMLQNARRCLRRNAARRTLTPRVPTSGSYHRHRLALPLLIFIILPRRGVRVRQAGQNEANHAVLCAFRRSKRPDNPGHKGAGRHPARLPFCSRTARTACRYTRSAPARV